MKFQGAFIKEQGVEFAIVIVKRVVLQDKIQANKTKMAFQGGVFQGAEVVLMAQDGRGIPRYYGREDIVRFLSKVPISCIPWKEYDVSI